MASSVCSRCGRPVPATSSFCPSCGAALGGPRSAPGVLPASGGTTTYAPPYRAATSLYHASAPPTAAADEHALSDVFWAATLGLIGTLLGLFELFGTSSASIVDASTTGGNTTLVVNVGALSFITGLAMLSFALAVVGLFLYRRAFQSLAVYDPIFSTPSTLVLLLVVAVLLAVVLFVGLLYEIFAAVACAAGGPLTSACLDSGLLLTLVLLLVVVGVALLIGFIGLLIGIWRLGTHYGSGLFKVGAILLIIPVVSVVGGLLVLVAARSSRRDLRARPTYGF